MVLDRRSVIRLALAAVPFGSLGFFIRHAAAMVKPGMQSVRGEVRINGVLAEPGSSVAPGDSVASGADGQAVFVVGQDAFLLRGNSEIGFSELNAVEEVLTVVSGQLLSVFGSRPLVIDTPVASIGIRGTGAYVEVYPERTYFCLCYGHAVLEAKLDPGAREELKTFHHDAPRTIYANPANHGGRAVEPAPMVNHQDEELIMLEALVGRIPDFGPKPIKM